MTALWLRTDLIETDDARNGRRKKLIDAISGRVAKVSRRDLATLRELGQATGNATAAAGQPPGDVAALVADAIGMGLMNRRPVARPGRWQRIWLTGPARWLCIRVPLVSIDPLARRLAQRSDPLFHPLAIAVWTLAILVAAASVLVGWDRAVLSATDMTVWGEHSLAGWTAIATIFVVTKILHELAHAVACRRAGAACGEIGLMLFVGMPCPYCNVSLVSRVDSTWARAGVMFAGIYVEWSLAAIATAVWWLVPAGPVQALAMNVMIVCGISTLVFNANPLMRLDGYYILSDLIGASNLRARAATAWQRLVSSRLGNWRRGRGPISWAETTLATYHAASACYRVTVMLAIAWMVIAISAALQVRPLGLTFAGLMLLPMVLAVASSIGGVWRGSGPWGQSHWIRRQTIVAATLGSVALLVLVPLRREIELDGILDLADATPIHATQSGWIVQHHAPWESSVTAGQALWQLDDPRLRLELAAWENRQRLAVLQSAALRRSALSDDSPDQAWDLDAANRRLVDSQWESLVQRRQRLTLVAPTSGILFPPITPANESGNKPASTAGQHVDTSGQIDDAGGRYAVAGDLLGRVGDPNRLAITLHADAQHRRLIRPDQTVRLIGDFGDPSLAPWTATTVVGSVSEIRHGDHAPAPSPQSAWNPPTNRFEIRCELPDGTLSGGDHRMIPPQLATLPLGARVTGRVRVGDESLWTRAIRSLRETLGE